MYYTILARDHLTLKPPQVIIPLTQYPPTPELIIPPAQYPPPFSIRGSQFTERFRLSWLTNSALEYEPNGGGGGGGGGAGSQPMSTAVHMEPK
jgi:hypothetical protein